MKCPSQLLPTQVTNIQGLLRPPANWEEEETRLTTWLQRQDWTVEWFGGQLEITKLDGEVVVFDIDWDHWAGFIPIGDAHHYNVACLKRVHLLRRAVFYVHALHNFLRLPGTESLTLLLPAA